MRAGLAVVLVALVGAAAAEAAWQVRIAGPATVTPGTEVTYRVSGLPPRARITVWLSPTINRGGNCCGVRPYIHGARATAAGVAHPRFRWPLFYKKCGAPPGCERVDWRSGQRVDLLVTWNSLSGRHFRAVRVR